MTLCVAHSRLPDCVSASQTDCSQRGWHWNVMLSDKNGNLPLKQEWGQNIELNDGGIWWHFLQQKQYHMMNYVVTWISVAPAGLSFKKCFSNAFVQSEISENLLDRLPLPNFSSSTIIRSEFELVQYFVYDQIPVKLITFPSEWNYCLFHLIKSNEQIDYSF